jgi:biopolymer transport protein ExbD
MRFQEKSKKRITINITSLIDVLFLLLIFFIVSSTFLEQPGMKLDLPRTQKQAPVRLEGYTLYILSDGSLFINDDAVTLEQLPERLEKIAPEVEERGLVLKADEGTRYGFVVEVMDMAKGSGIGKLVIATQPKEEAEGQ